MRRWLQFVIVLVMTATTQAQHSNIKRDEIAVLFPSIGRMVEGGNAWEIDVHGWVHEPERRGLTLAALRRVFDLKDLSARELELFKERARIFMVDNERGKKIHIRFGERTVELKKSDANGHFFGTVRLGHDEVEKLRAGNRLSFQVVLPAGDDRVFAGEVYLIDGAGISVISDIDDTIKVTNVRSTGEMLRKTFLQPFEAVGGMKDIYSDWAKAGDVQFHYLSASPWQLYVPLVDFVRTNGFPEGTFHLKTFRWKDQSFFSLFGSPEDYKIPKIEALIREFPEREFVLVGDSGELDPEIFGTIARAHSKQVKAIFIRDTTGEEIGSERYKKAFKGIPVEKWRVFKDAKEIGDTSVK